MKRTSTCLFLVLATASCRSPDWSRVCKCDTQTQIDDCVVNEEPADAPQITSSGEIDTGEGSNPVSLSPTSESADAPATVQDAKICLCPAGDIRIGGAFAEANREHLLYIEDLNSQNPTAFLRSHATTVIQPVTIERNPLLTSYLEMGWSFVDECSETYLYVHGGESTTGKLRGPTNGVRIRIESCGR